MSYELTISDISQGAEPAGIGLLIIGDLSSVGSFAWSLARRLGAERQSPPNTRQVDPCWVLEILVGADIVRTAAGSPRYQRGRPRAHCGNEDVPQLSLQAGLDGEWPWRRKGREMAQARSSDEAAIGRPRPGVDSRHEIPRHVNAELERVWEMYVSGFAREIYSPGGPGIVLIIETTSVEEARAELAELPLAANHVIDCELIELQPFAAFRTLVRLAGQAMNTPTRNCIVTQLGAPADGAYRSRQAAATVHRVVMMNRRPGRILVHQTADDLRSARASAREDGNHD